MEYEAVIGLEIHVQLKTKSKMFCSCDNASSGAAPNTLICPVCTGHPGTLPVPNRQAVEWAILSALALGCTVPEHSKFDRKHYFYPDLPKGYQISQYDEPIGIHGTLTIPSESGERVVGIERLHLEEDVGKMLHTGDATLIDYNRAGTPLMEIVTQPDLRSPGEAKRFLQELRSILRSLGVSNADMENGELRCDANLSLRPEGTTELHPKTEIKNLNSFRSVEQALAFEFDRQLMLWEAGSPPAQQSTRGWDEGQTTEQRVKETAADYRFMPEPDIPPMHFAPDYLSELRAKLPELPANRRSRFVEAYNLTQEQANALVEDQELANLFEEVVSELRLILESETGRDDAVGRWTKPDQRAASTRPVANWLLNRISAKHRQEHGLPVPAQEIAKLLRMVSQGTVTLAAAATVYEQMVKTKKTAEQLVEEHGLTRMSDAVTLDAVARSIVEKHPHLVEQYWKGKTVVLQRLIGLVMKETKGSADAAAVTSVLRSLLDR